jgi:tetratricopeptide (TPR) repeat protein
MSKSLRPRPLAAPALFALLLVLLGCARGVVPLAELRRLCPNIPDPVAGYLLASSDSMLARHARDVGVRAMRNLRTQIDVALMSGPPEEYPARLAVLRAPCLRIGRILAHEFADDEYLRDFQERFGKDLPTQIRSIQLFARVESARRDTSFSYVEMKKLLLATVDELRRMGFTRVVHILEGDLSNLYDRMGDQVGRRKWLEASIRHARDNRDHYMVCQQSGLLASLEEPPRNRIILEEAIELANRYQFGDQLVRLTAFLANLHIREGRLSLAHTLTLQAEELCRRQKADTYELDFAVAMAHRYFEWGAWEVSRRFLERSQVLLPLAVARNDPKLRVEVTVNVRLLELQELLSRRRFDEAAQMSADIERLLLDKMHDRQYNDLLRLSARAFIDAGRADQALPLIRKALDRARRRNIAVFYPRLLELEADALLDLGRIDEAGACLAAFDTLELRRASEIAFRHEARKVQLSLACGKIRESFATLASACDSLLWAVSRLDAGTASYLYLEGVLPLRTAAHELFAGDARAGYDFELFWRTLPALMGSGNHESIHHRRPALQVASTGTTGRIRAGGNQPRLKPGDVHLVYSVQQDHIIRWTRTTDDLRRDQISRSRYELETGDLPALTWNSDRETSEERTAALKRLRFLIPDVVLNGRVGGTLLVTPDGALNQVSFERIDIGSESAYVPLLADWDVVYYRGSTGVRNGTAGNVAPSLVIASPTITDRVRRRFPDAPELESSLPEAQLAARVFHPARLITGKEATWSAFRAAARKAPVIYAAAHVFHDADTPFLSYLPLATDTVGSSSFEDMLDVTAVRRLDLSHCRLVVLSSCRSGALVGTGSTVGPCLGDAFLDAGAASIVQTLWPVSDRDAEILMTEFLERLSEVNGNPAKALNAARRTAWQSLGTQQDWPVWANYHVVVNEYPAIHVNVDTASP